MTQGIAAGIRINPHNPNHHLWDNNGTWFVHYTVYPTPVTAERIRRSLRTKELAIARQRRDEILATVRNGRNRHAHEIQMEGAEA